jgi:hypothetical protein
LKKQLQKSKFRIKGIDKLLIHYDRYNPTRGGSYIELPKWIADKKACINIKNDDNKCSKYSIQCGVYKIYEKKNPQELRHYSQLTDNINWEGVTYPAGNRDFDRLEEHNNKLISVNIYNVFEFEGKETIVLHRRTKVVGAKHHVNLLKIEDEKDKFHYVLIKDYDKLIGNQTNKDTHKLFHCRYCQHGFKRQNLLDEHLKRGCLAVEGQSVKLPDEGETISFKNHAKQFKCPFVMYGDFECLTTKTGHYSKPVDPTKSYTTKYQQHSPSGFKLIVVNSNGETVDTVIYRGTDCMDVFCKRIREIESDIMKTLTGNKAMIMTEQDKQDFANATKCYICGEEIMPNDKKGCKVRDHCHITGKYRGCAHNVCNINYNYKNLKIPVFFHNLKNYDAHLIISNAKSMNCKKKIDVIAQNSEKFITFGFDHLLFKDSFSFLSSSLEKLVKMNKYKEVDGVDVLIDNWQDNFKFSQNTSMLRICTA